jgi:hypothetical protein
VDKKQIQIDRGGKRVIMTSTRIDGQTVIQTTSPQPAPKPGKGGKAGKG